MRDHLQIIRDAGDDEKVADALCIPLNTVRAWKQRNRISHTRWSEFVEQGWTTFEELAAAIRAAA